MVDSGHSAVGTVLRMLRWQWGLIGLAAAFLLFWDPINDWLNFEDVEVVVTKVVNPCSFIPSDRDKAAGYRTCIQFSFDYRSPADGQVHTGSIIRFAQDSDPQLIVGHKVVVQASNRAATRVRDIPR